MFLRFDNEIIDPRGHVQDPERYIEFAKRSLLQRLGQGIVDKLKIPIKQHPPIDMRIRMTAEVFVSTEQQYRAFKLGVAKALNETIIDPTTADKLAELFKKFESSEDEKREDTLVPNALLR